MNENSTKRFTRLLRIIRELDAGGLRLALLAAESGVSLRTLQRDMAALDEAKFPFRCVDGKYSFAEGFSLKSAYTTDKEAAMLVFLSDITKSLGKDFDKPFEGIRRKVLCPDGESPFYVKTPKGPAYSQTPLTEQLVYAVEGHKIIEIEYDGKRRTVQPYKIINYDGFWYLYAVVKGEKRAFMLDYITDSKPTDKTFTPKPSVLKRLDESTNIWFGLKPKTRVKLLVNAKAAYFFKAKPYFPRQKIINTYKNGDIIIETTVGHEAEVLHTVFSWIPQIKIISPKKLRNAAEKKAREFLK